jgi:hypothetical protein
VFTQLLVLTRGHGDIVSSSCDYFKQSEPFAMCVGVGWTKGLWAFNIPPAFSFFLNAPRDRNEVDGVNLIAFSELLVLTRGHGDIISSSCNYFKQPFALCVGLERTKACGLLISHLLNSPTDRNKVDGANLIAFSELLVLTRGHWDIV